MSLTKIEIAQIQASYFQVTHLLSKGDAMTYLELSVKIPRLTGAALGYMIRTKKVFRCESGERDKNYNHIYLYSLEEKNIKRVKPIKEKQLQIQDVWPVSVPVGNGHVVRHHENHSKSNAVYRQPGLKSCHGNLVNLCG